MISHIEKSRKAIAVEAAEWFVQMHGQQPTSYVKKRFANWILESPVHIEEYLAVATIFDALQHVDPQKDIKFDRPNRDIVVDFHEGIEDASRSCPEGYSGTEQSDPHWQKAVTAPRSSNSLIAKFQNDSQQAPVFGKLSKNVVRIRRGTWRRVGVPLLAAGVVLSFLLLPIALYLSDLRPDLYTTALGEQRSVILEDGSIVSLNTSTRIEVAFTEENRFTRLIEGEALFDIEKDNSRPFVVETAFAQIRVTGTQFNVYERNADTAVTVLEGEVEVRPTEAASSAELHDEVDKFSSTMAAGGITKLSVGQQAVVKSGSAEIETKTVGNLDPVTAWMERRLVFDATPLSEIVEQFNRYNRKQLVIDDADLRSLELSGVFGSNDPESLILFLQHVAEITVITSNEQGDIRIVAANSVR